MTKITYIPGEIANAAIDEHGNRKPVTRTHHIFDNVKNKNQAEINAEVDDTFAFHQSEINALDSQNYESYTAVSGQTLADILPATGEIDTIYRVGNWDGTQYDTTKYTEYAWFDGAYKQMNVKEVGIDDEPTEGSDNFVKSGGIAKLCNLFIKGICNITDILRQNEELFAVDAKKNDIIKVTATNSNSATWVIIRTKDGDGNIIDENASLVEAGANLSVQLVISSSIVRYVGISMTSWNYFASAIVEHIKTDVGVINLPASPTASFSRRLNELEGIKYAQIKVSSSASSIIFVPFNNGTGTVISLPKDKWVCVDFSLFTNITAYYECSAPVRIEWRELIKPAIYELDIFPSPWTDDSAGSLILDLEQNKIKWCPNGNTVLEAFPNAEQNYIGWQITGNEIFLYNGKKYVYNNGVFSVLSEGLATLSHDAESSAIWWQVDELAGKKLILRVKTEGFDMERSFVFYGSSDGVNYEPVNTTSCMAFAVADFSAYTNVKVYYKSAYTTYIDYTLYNSASLLLHREYDIVVAKDGTGDYTDAFRAIIETGQGYKRHYSIFIKDGEYEMPAQSGVNFAWDRLLTIVGESRERTVLYNNNGEYTQSVDNAVLRLSGDVTIRNLSLISRDTDYQGGGSAEAYCIHADFDTQGSRTMEIVDCNMYNDHFACIGIGLRQDYNIKIRNCELISLGSTGTQGWSGAIVCHDGNNGGNSNLIVTDNYISSGMDNAINVQATYNNGVDVLLQKNAIFAGGSTPIVIGEGCTLNSNSCLNNVEI